jgi:hypothetical protein
MPTTELAPKYDRRQPSKGPYSAIVYIDGSQVVAEDSVGRVIASGVAGTDDATVINAAYASLTAGRTWKEKVILKGNFSIKATIPMISYTDTEIIGSMSLDSGSYIFRQMVQDINDIDIHGGYFVQPATLDHVAINPFWYQASPELWGHCYRLNVHHCTFSNFIQGIQGIPYSSQFLYNYFYCCQRGIEFQAGGNNDISWNQVDVDYGPHREDWAFYLGDMNYRNTVSWNKIAVINTDTGYYNKNGIAVNSCTNVILEENTINNVPTYPICINYTAVSNPTSDIYILRNKITDGGYDGAIQGAICIAPAAASSAISRIWIDGNDIYNCRRALGVGHSPANIAAQLEFTHNTYHNDGNVMDAVALYGNAYNIFMDGNIFLCATAGILGTGILNCKRNTGFFVGVNSGSSTGTGAEQTIAHGLYAAPHKVDIVPTVTDGLIIKWWADATNIYVTVTSGKAYNWSAEV